MNLRFGLIVCFLLARLAVLEASGNTALDFLKIDSGARASALSGAYSSYGSDSFAVFYNPALGAALQASRVDLMHYEYFEDLRLENASGIVRVSPYYALGAGITYLYSGPILRTRRDDNIEGYSASGHYTASDLLVLLCNSFRPGRSFFAGISLKYLRETLDAEKAVTFAADAGILLRPGFGPGLNVSLSVQNMGLPVRFVEKKENLPLLIRSGLSYGFSPVKWNRKGRVEDLNFSADAVKPADDRMNFRFGCEVFFLDLFAVRLGYRLNPVKDDLGGPSFGAGIFAGPLDINYAFVPYEFLGPTHRFSVGYQF